MKVLRYCLYIYNIVILYATSVSVRDLRHYNSANKLVRFFLPPFYITPCLCTSTFFVVFNEPHTCINISVKTLRRYIKGILYYTPTTRLQSSNHFIIGPVAHHTDFCPVMVLIIEIIFNITHSLWSMVIHHTSNSAITINYNIILFV